MEKYRNANNMCDRMSQRKFSQRPNCEEILDERHLWALNVNDLENDKKLKKILDSDVGNDFSVENMIRIKLNKKGRKRQFHYVL